MTEIEKLFECLNCDQTHELQFEENGSRLLLRCMNCQTGWMLDPRLPAYPTEDDEICCPDNNHDMLSLENTISAAIYARARYATSRKTAIAINAKTNTIHVTDYVTHGSARARLDRVADELIETMREMMKKAQDRHEPGSWQNNASTTEERQRRRARDAVNGNPLD